MKVGSGLFLLAALSPSPSANELRQSLDVQIPLLPAPVVSDGRSMLVFEVHATNFTSDPLDLRAIRILDDRRREIATYAGETLARRVKLLSISSHLTPTTIVAGGRAIIYIEVDVPSGAHASTFEVEIDCFGSDGRSFTLRSANATADRTGVPVLAPPLKGGSWVAVHDPSWERGHRRVIYTLAGRARIPGRYAIDWVGVDDEGRVSKGDPDLPVNAVGYGVPVLAGADAVVTATRNDMQEAQSIARNPAHPLGDGSGNYVVLRLGTNRFAFYEHLKPGSIRVRPGDRVRVGQTIAALGFTGDTTGPHLHLHVADCRSPLECEGVPFAIRGMEEVGRYENLSDLGKRRWQGGKARGRVGPEWPDYNVVVRFPN